MRSTQRDTNQTSTIVGRVNSTPAILSGTGFSVTKQSTGVFVVRPNRRGTNINFTASANENSYYLIAAQPGSNGAMTVYTFNSSTGAPADCGFSFSMTQLEAA